MEHFKATDEFNVDKVKLVAICRRSEAAIELVGRKVNKVKPVRETASIKIKNVHFGTLREEK